MIIGTINYQTSKKISLVHEDFKLFVSKNIFDGYVKDNEYHFYYDSSWFRWSWLKPKIICSLYNNNEDTNIQVQIFIRFLDMFRIITTLVISIFGFVNMIPFPNDFSLLAKLFFIIFLSFFGTFFIIQYCYYVKKLLEDIIIYINGGYDKLLYK